MWVEDPPRWNEMPIEEYEDYYLVPNYVEDLNAMNKAEKSLTKLLWWNYVEHLKDVCGGGLALGISASSSQRAKAFLKNLNYWENL